MFIGFSSKENATGPKQQMNQNKHHYGKYRNILRGSEFCHDFTILIHVVFCGVAY